VSRKSSSSCETSEEEATLTKSTEIIAHNSAIIEQITKKLGA
jgi:hypothetical protein